MMSDPEAVTRFESNARAAESKFDRVTTSDVYFQISFINRRGCNPSMSKLKTMSLFGLFEQLFQSRKFLLSIESLLL